MGNLTKGFIFDSHSYSFSDKTKKIGFTEAIARTLAEYELETTQNIIIIEKNAAATRLVEMKFSELTNSCIVTVGGNFNRAVWYLTDLYKDKKNIIFLTDGDVYGDDMMRGIEFGTMNSRHLPYKFPPSQYPNIFLSGLWPSIGEYLGLPNDVSQKRPLNNPFAKKRLEFLERYNLVSHKDIDTWNRNKTYELEALSTTFRAKDGNPVGLGIYLIEIMRFFNIPIKKELPDDETLKEDFDRAAIVELRREIRDAIDEQNPGHNLVAQIMGIIGETLERVKDKIFEELVEDYEKCLEEVTAKEIKYHIYKQFDEDPGRKEYNLYDIAHKLKSKFKVQLLWKAERLIEDMVDQLEDHIRDNDVINSYDHEVEFTPIHNETEKDEMYDLALREIGADPEDAAKVREAIEWRFG